MLRRLIQQEARDMKIGSEAHKQLFCNSFLESHRLYEPEDIHWPSVDGATLERL